MLRPRWFGRTPHCGLERVRTETTTTNPSSNLVARSARLAAWLPEFVDDVEVITRGDGTGGVQQIGLTPAD